MNYTQVSVLCKVFKEKLLKDNGGMTRKEENAENSICQLQTYQKIIFEKRKK